MSGQGYAAVPNWLVDSLEFTAHDKLVYMVLARHVDEYGAAFPGIKSIATRAGISESAVKRAKKHLLETGLIEILASRRHERGPRDAGDVTTDVLKVHTSRPRPTVGGPERPRKPVDNRPEGRGHTDPRVGGRGQRDPRAEVSVTSGLGSEGPPNNPRGTTPDEARAGGSTSAHQLHPVDNHHLADSPHGSPPVVEDLPPLRPLARPERCAVHQHDVVPPPCGACKDARLTLELVEAEVARVPLTRCEHNHVAATCPYCPGGRLAHLDSA